MENCKMYVGILKNYIKNSKNNFHQRIYQYNLITFTSSRSVAFLDLYFHLSHIQLNRNKDLLSDKCTVTIKSSFIGRQIFRKVLTKIIKVLTKHLMYIISSSANNCWRTDHSNMSYLHVALTFSMIGFFPFSFSLSSL